MSAQIKDGGPAFPVPDSNSNGHVECNYIGMTLRDYFAAKAMVALIAEPPWSEDSTPAVKAWTRDISNMVHEDLFAIASYRMADAMLRAREVQP